MGLLTLCVRFVLCVRALVGQVAPYSFEISVYLWAECSLCFRWFSCCHTASTDELLMYQRLTGLFFLSKCFLNSDYQSEDWEGSFQAWEWMIRSRNVVVGWRGNLIRKRGRGEEGVCENRSDMIFYSEFLLSYYLSCRDFSWSKKRGGGSCRIPFRAWIGKFAHQKLILWDKTISLSKFR